MPFRKPTDIVSAGASLYFLPVQTRVPLKFGNETLTSVTCARVRLEVRDQQGKSAVGWGETPLSVQWVWPSALPYAQRHEALKEFCVRLAKAWSDFPVAGHPMEIGHAFQRDRLHALLEEFNHEQNVAEPMPHLASLVCCSAFDLALHDAYGILLQKPVYQTYNANFMNEHLGFFLEPAEGASVTFAGRYPEDYFVKDIPTRLPAWHLVGGMDKLEASELDESELDDGFPVLLRDWIRRDGLTCLKIKLRGNDAAFDYRRLEQVGAITVEMGVPWLTTDFNCTVTDPRYVIDILDRLEREHPEVHKKILYVEQPFPYELEKYPIDVHSLSAKKPLFMDESAHDWTLVRLGLRLGWTGVALKTCKTQTGAILAACWAKAHGMPLMVQDLTNPMLAQIPHVQLAAHVGTIMGVETNSMQFYPDASKPEEAVHPGLYRRRNGIVDRSTLTGPGFGYAIHAIERTLPAPAYQSA